MSKREWLVFIAKAQGYMPSDDDTDTDLVWVIRNYTPGASCASRRWTSTRPDRETDDSWRQDHA